MKCDICNYEGDDVVAGRWIFYCPKHKSKDWEMTYENEIDPMLKNSNYSGDGELDEMMLENL
jgi:hypothetical protein